MRSIPRSSPVVQLEMTSRSMRRWRQWRPGFKWPCQIPHQERKPLDPLRGVVFISLWPAVSPNMSWNFRIDPSWSHHDAETFMQVHFASAGYYFSSAMVGNELHLILAAISRCCCCCLSCRQESFNKRRGRDLGLCRGLRFEILLSKTFCHDYAQFWCWSIW